MTEQGVLTGYAPSTAKRYRFAVPVLFVIMFFTGLVGAVSEYILSTTASYILGNSIAQFAVTISLMFGMMGVGSYVTKFIKTDSPITAFVVIEMILAVIIGIAPTVMIASFGYLEHDFKFIQYFLAGSIALLLGAELPLAVRIAKDFAAIPENLSSNLFGDYLGGAVGGFLFASYFTMVRLNQISFIVGGSALLAGTICYFYFFRQQSMRRRITCGIALGVVAAFLVVGYNKCGHWALVLDQRLYKDPVIFETTSPYQRIVLTYNNARERYQLYLNRNLQFDSLDEKRYHDFLVHPAMSFMPSGNNLKVLVLGGGDGLALRELNKYGNVGSVTLVDLDPDMIKASKTQPELVKLNRASFANAKVKILPSDVKPGDLREMIMEGDRSLRARNAAPQSMKISVNVMHIDADKFLNALVSNVYDVVIIDFPDPRSVELSKLYSVEFYSKVQRFVAEHGVVAIQSTSVYYSKECYLMIGRTLKAAGFNILQYHGDVPSFGDWGYHLCWKDGRTVDEMKTQLKTLKGFPVETEYITPLLVANAVDFGKGVLDSQYPNDVNTLMRPMLLQLYMKSLVVD